MKTVAFFASTLLVAIGLTGCGGGGTSTSTSSGSGGGSTTPTVKSGYFIDSPVEGINFSTATQSGKTNSQGQFSYVDGESVTFSVGAITLPPVAAASRVTPLDIVGVSDATNTAVTNILIFLQSIDSDGDPSNGISIPTSAAGSATSTLDFTEPTATFVARTALTTLVASITGAVLKTETQAQTHFYQTATTEGIAVTPVANAGLDQSVVTGTSVTLDGSASRDANGDAVTYAWAITSKPSGSFASLSSTSVIGPTFTADVPGSYVFALTVSDGRLTSASDWITVTAATVQLDPSKQIFSSDYIQLPSPANIVKNVCTSESKTGSFGSNLAIADMNGDKRPEIIMIYWCAYSYQGQDFDGPTPNTLIVYLSQPDGSYIIGNKTLFGSDLVNVGGYANGYTIGDFNGDGKPDIGIGVSKEDGRAFGNNGSTWQAEQVVLLSQADGHYTVEKLPVKTANGFVYAVDNDVNGQDFVYSATPRSPLTAYRWQNGIWNQVLDYPNGGILVDFMPRPSLGTGTTKLITNSLDVNDGVSSLQIQEKINGTWSAGAKFVIPSTNILFSGRNGQIVQTSIVTIEGVRYTYGVFERACNFKLYPNNDYDYIFVTSGGGMIPKSWDGISLLDEKTLIGASLLLPFSISNGISFDSSIIDSVPNYPQFTNFQCVDINNDGYMDLIINTQGYNFQNRNGGPEFYINNKSGKLIKTSGGNLPTPPLDLSSWQEASSYVVDMNADGIPDLVYWTTSFSVLDNNSFRIHLGNKYVGQ